MYFKYLKPVAGFYMLLLTACSGVRTINSADNAIATIAAGKQHAISSNKKISLTGPPEYVPDTAKTDDRVVEKGGKYTYITPAYTRLRPETGADEYSAGALLKKITKIKSFAAANNYDTAVAFFVDMQVKSGKARFFVINLANDNIIKKGLVAHGKGDEKFTFNRKFSNGTGSNCTSLGVYKIGKAYNGAFGLSYKLYGLNKTNSNAFKRFVVLHSMGSIPDEESKFPITQTEGCPAVAPAFLAQLATILDAAPKNVLLYIYNGIDD